MGILLEFFTAILTVVLVVMMLFGIELPWGLPVGSFIMFVILFVASSREILAEHRALMAKEDATHG